MPKESPFRFRFFNHTRFRVASLLGIIAGVGFLYEGITQQVYLRAVIGILGLLVAWASWKRAKEAT